MSPIQSLDGYLSIKDASLDVCIPDGTRDAAMSASTIFR